MPTFLNKGEKICAVIDVDTIKTTGILATRAITILAGAVVQIRLLFVAVAIKGLLSMQQTILCWDNIACSKARRFSRKLGIIFFLKA